MIRKKFFLLILIFFTLIISGINAINVGVSPYMANLGVLEPGTARIVKFNLITGTGETILVYLASERGNVDVFRRGNYLDYIQNYSEEDVSSWVKFLENPVIMGKSPEGQKTTTGNPIVGEREVTLIINVPEDAESGYHTGIISIDPRLPPGAPGTVVIKGVVPFNFVFQVPGDAIRSGRIIDVSSGSYSGNRLGVNVFFQNTGTVTMITKDSIIKTYDNKNREIDNLKTNLDEVKPGQTKTFTAYWDVSDVDVGTYRASTTIDYLTDKSSKTSDIQVYKVSALPTPQVVKQPITFPWWVIIIVIVIIIIAYLIYRS